LKRGYPEIMNDQRLIREIEQGRFPAGAQGCRLVWRNGLTSLAVQHKRKSNAGGMRGGRPGVGRQDSNIDVMKRKVNRQTLQSLGGFFICQTFMPRQDPARHEHHLAPFLPLPGENGGAFRKP